MSNVETIKVIYKPGNYEMVINAVDFDEKIHEKINEEKTVNKKSTKKILDDNVKALIGEE